MDAGEQRDSEQREHGGFRNRHRDFSLKLGGERTLNAVKLDAVRLNEPGPKAK
jgi:hypothetical protein